MMINFIKMMNEQITYCIVGIYYNFFSFTNFAISNSLAKFKASTHSSIAVLSMYLPLWMQHSKLITNIASENKIM